MAQNLSLIFDLSCSGFAAVLDSEGGVLSRRSRSATVRNDDIASWLEACLAEAYGDFTSLERIMVGIGPGSFTSIRIAMAFAQGLAFPRALPLHGFTSLSALLVSKPASIAAPIVAAIPANSGRYYIARGMEDAGTLVDAESLRRLGNDDAVLLVHEESPAWDAIRPAFAGVEAVAERIDFQALARHAQGAGRGARQPSYLQPPAAETRFANP